MAETGPMVEASTEHWRRAVMCTFAGIFAASALGGLVGGLSGGGALAAPGHAQAEEARTATASRAGGTASAAAGARTLLTLSDLPPGWVSGGPAAAPTRLSPWSTQLASCVGVPARLAALAPTKVTSPDFSSADKTLTVQDSVSAYRTAAQARADDAALSSPKMPTCMNAIGSAALQASIQQRAGSGATVGTVTITALPAAWHAEHVSGFTVTIPLVSGGRQLTITSTEVAFVRGAEVHQVTFNGNGTAFPGLLQARLVQTVQRRH
jgi:hypothetical protein